MFGLRRRRHVTLVRGYALAAFNDLAIKTALTLRAVFRLALRQSEGLIGSIMRML
jgi:hypothetical protein